MRGQLIVVLGGMRSGKSEVAERLASAIAGDEPVTYLATARPEPDDADHAARIARHRERRPGWWDTVECATPARAVAALYDVRGVVLLDSLGTWVAGHDDLDPDVPGLVAALQSRRDPTVVVAEEVGLSVHPPSELGRRFADALGAANRAVADVADDAYLVVAGRALALPLPGTPPDPPPC